ncbi:MAG: phosphate ABC transporter substrate-binding protein [Treponema sp.]|nr:phosphate ABC transporter substrate-binding protein [Treponema sp.]
MKRLFGIFSAMVFVFFVFTGCEKKSESQPVSEMTVQEQPVTITVGGSTSVNPLMEMFIAEYSKNNSNVTFTVSATGSGDGIKGAAENTYEIGMSSRELSPAEIGTGIDGLIIAIDGIAVIINNANPVNSLSTDQIKDIYTGAVTRWEELGASANGKTGSIAVVSREPGSGTRGAFEEILKFQDQLVRGAIEFDGTGAIKAEVSRNVDAVGYISLGSLDSGIKALNVDGVAATTENVVAGTYLIARPFILVTKKNITIRPQTQAFLDWIMGNEGQSIVASSWIRVN